MSTFRLEMFDGAGKVEFTRYIQISGTNTVDEALTSSEVKKFKELAKLKGLAFRIKREDE